MERGFARRIGQARLDGPEQVVDAIDLVRAIKRVAFQVQEEIARARVPAAPQSPRSGTRAFSRSRSGGMRSEITLPSPRTWMAACACTRASASGLTPSIFSGSGGDGMASPRRVVTSMCVQRPALAGRQTGHQRQVVFPSPLGAALQCPATEIRSAPPALVSFALDKRPPSCPATPRTLSPPVGSTRRSRPRAG